MKRSIIVFVLFILFACSKKAVDPALNAIPGWSPPYSEYKNQHIRWAYCLDVYDGDSATFIIQLGFNSFQVWKTRFLDIDAPEIRGGDAELGKASKKWLADQILDKYVIIEAPNGLDKYGRLLVRVYLGDDIELTQSLNAKMVELGLAKVYKLKQSDLLAK